MKNYFYFYYLIRIRIGGFKYENLNEMPEILEISDLIDYLRISRSGAYRLVEKKRIPGVQVIGKIHDTKIIINKMVSKART